jgi:hypothetical protein
LSDRTKSTLASQLRVSAPPFHDFYKLSVAAALEPTRSAAQMPGEALSFVFACSRHLAQVEQLRRDALVGR